MIEIELRFLVEKKEEVDSFIKELQPISTQRIIDHYYDTPTLTLSKRHAYIRIRNQETLNIKFNRATLADPTRARQAHHEEYDFQLPLKSKDLASFSQHVAQLGLLPAPTIDQFLKQNNLSISRTLDKIRASYKKEAYTIVLDEIATIGTFLEIEYLTDTSQSVDTIKEQMILHLSPIAHALKPHNPSNWLLL